MPVEMTNPWKKRQFWKRERQTIFNKAYEEEKLKQLKQKREHRVAEIQKKAREKAYRKYGMTNKDKLGYYLQKIRNGVEKARKEIEWMQKDLEEDLNNERFY